MDSNGQQGKVAAMDQANADLLRFEEAAAYLRRTTEGLRLLRKKGIGPSSFMMGGRRFYRRSECDRWIRQCEQEAAIGCISA
jgi:hypothetical protein